MIHSDNDDYENYSNWRLNKKDLEKLDIGACREAFEKGDNKERRELGLETFF